jgi:hypothetical protein
MKWANFGLWDVQYQMLAFHLAWPARVFAEAASMTGC